MGVESLAIDDKKVVEETCIPIDPNQNNAVLKYVGNIGDTNKKTRRGG